MFIDDKRMPLNVWAPGSAVTDRKVLEVQTEKRDPAFAEFCYE